MSWYEDSVFYHIYPLGLCGAPLDHNDGVVTHRLRDIFYMPDYLEKLGCNGVYIGPLFQSIGHGYETTDYRTLDSRLGDNEDLKEFVLLCHQKNIKVILDGVFNHTGREFFAFKDLLTNRESSPYRDWYCNVNFGGNNEYNDGFCYDNWGGYNLLVKLNQRNPEVIQYLLDSIRMWISEFDIDGIRLDAADVLDFDFMKQLRSLANEVKPDFWLMGEVIHGEYNHWVNGDTLHAVTNYNLHKALYSGHNDHNYFEIAHTVKRLYEMGGCHYKNMELYSFVDNHDVERIVNRVNNKDELVPIYFLLFTLPGIPSIYYGSEFAIEGRKEQGSDASLRPAIAKDTFYDALANNDLTKLIATLAQVHKAHPALCQGEYRECVLTNRQYAFARDYEGETIFTCVNNDENTAELWLSGISSPTLTNCITGEVLPVTDGSLCVKLEGCSGVILAENK